MENYLTGYEQWINRVGDSTPAGVIFDYLKNKPLPAGWLYCKGQRVHEPEYPKLYAELRKNRYCVNVLGEVHIPDIPDYIAGSFTITHIIKY